MAMELILALMALLLKPIRVILLLQAQEQRLLEGQTQEVLYSKQVTLKYAQILELLR